VNRLRINGNWHQVGHLIAMLVNEGDDWKDVQIPAQSGATSQAAAAKADAKPKEATAARLGEHHFEHAAKAGPATNLLMAQYGIKAEYVIHRHHQF
jgi:pyruvate/2-oxoglutarate dehydrogenase complex dihydrolipoamide acyltransferase (E2) component